MTFIDEKSVLSVEELNKRATHRRRAWGTVLLVAFWVWCLPWLTDASVVDDTRPGVVEPTLWIIPLIGLSVAAIVTAAVLVTAGAPFSETTWVPSPGERYERRRRALLERIDAERLRASALGRENRLRRELLVAKADREAQLAERKRLESEAGSGELSVLEPDDGTAAAEVSMMLKQMPRRSTDGRV